MSFVSHTVVQTVDVTERPCVANASRLSGILDGMTVHNHASEPQGTRAFGPAQRADSRA